MQSREMIACESATLLSGIATEGAAPLETGNIVDDDKPGIVIEDCTIIEGDRWGSSGYYEGAALEKAAAKNVFHTDLQVFEDHADPNDDRAGKLMGHLEGDARFVLEDGVPKLKGPVRFFSDRADWVKERIRHLGLSIRAGVLFEDGVREGRTGKIITDFTQAISVDVVARAGAGGKFGSIKESEVISADTNNEGGADVALSKEDAAALGAAVAEALAPKLDAIATAVAESAKPTFKEFTPGELAAELGKSTLTQAGQAKVWSVFEAKGDVEAAITAETEHEKQVREAAAGAPNGLTITGKDGEPNGPTATESDVPNGWGTIAKEGN